MTKNGTVAFLQCRSIDNNQHGSAEEGYYPHELLLEYEVCQIKGTLTNFIKAKIESNQEFTDKIRF